MSLRFGINHSGSVCLLASSLVLAATSCGTGPGVSTTLAFMVQPRDVPVGGMISPPVQVVVRDASGNTVPGATTRITIGIANAPAATWATLSGTLTQSAAAGVATFSDLSIDEPDAAYALTASAAGSASATSAGFAVTWPPDMRGNYRFTGSSGGHPFFYGSAVITPQNGSGFGGTYTVTDASGSLNGASYPLSGIVDAATVTLAIQFPAGGPMSCGGTYSKGTVTGTWSVPYDPTLHGVPFSGNFTLTRI